MRNVYFTADLHLDHRNIIKYCNRLFCLSNEEKANLVELNSRDYTRDELRKLYISDDSLKRMNDGIIDSINSKVDDSDTLYILGDFGFARNSEFHKIESFRKRITCRNIHFIIGNHDNFSKSQYQSIFSSVHTEWMVRHNGHKIFMHHFPLLEWDGSFHNVIHCFGHCHSNKNEWIQENMPSAKMIDVGVDNWEYGPISLEEVISFTNRNIIKRSYQCNY